MKMNSCMAQIWALTTHFHNKNIDGKLTFVNIEWLRNHLMAVNVHSPADPQYYWYQEWIDENVNGYLNGEHDRLSITSSGGMLGSSEEAYTDKIRCYIHSFEFEHDWYNISANEYDSSKFHVIRRENVDNYEREIISVMGEAGILNPGEELHTKLLMIYQAIEYFTNLEKCTYDDIKNEVSPPYDSLFDGWLENEHELHENVNRQMIICYLYGLINNYIYNTHKLDPDFH